MANGGMVMAIDIKKYLSSKKKAAKKQKGNGDATAANGGMATINYKEYRLSKKEARGYFLVFMIGSVAMGWLFYKSLLAAIPLFIVSLAYKKHYERSLARNKQRELLGQFKDLLYSLGASFGSGRQMSKALLEAEKNLEITYGKKSLLLSELSLINRKISSELQREESVLEDFAKRTGLEDVIDFFNSYFICKESGGDMGKLINTAANSIIEKIELENEIEVLVSKKKFEARILTVVPVVLILFLQLSSSDYLSILYVTAMGRIVMTAALALMAFSYYLSSKITQIDV
jgi:tight adherence protein B